MHTIHAQRGGQAAHLSLCQLPLNLQHQRLAVPGLQGARSLKGQLASLNHATTTHGLVNGTARGGGPGAMHRSLLHLHGRLKRGFKVRLHRQLKLKRWIQSKKLHQSTAGWKLRDIFQARLKIE